MMDRLMELVNWPISSHEAILFCMFSIEPAREVSAVR